MLNLLLAAVGVLAQPSEPAATPGIGAVRSYAEGQVWEYRTRSQDAGSLMRIQRIEARPGGAASDPIYHISIVGVRFPANGIAGMLQHLPAPRATLDASVTRLSDSAVPFPDPSPGIAQWREARGGVFDIPLAEIVGYVERIVTEDAPPER